MHATKADISGAINATSGTFENVTIKDSCTINGIKLNSNFLRNANLSDSIVTNRTVGNREISNGKISDLNAGKVNAGTMSAYRVRGGQLNIDTAGGGYLKVGVETVHPSVSGLNAYGGFNMHGNEIGNCNKISVNTITGDTTDLTIDSNPTITGSLHCNNKIYGYGFNNFADGIDL